MTDQTAIAPTKPWYKSKTIWTMIVLIIMGILPMVTPFVQALQRSQTAVDITAAVVTLLGGILTIIWRVSGTPTTIS